MTTYYDLFSQSTPGTCCNCGASVDKLIKGRCRACDAYHARRGIERPAHLWTPTAPAWGVFKAEEAALNTHIWCDCGKVATRTLTVPISGNGKTTLLLCEACAALERRLAPVHSWAGG